MPAHAASAAIATIQSVGFMRVTNPFTAPSPWQCWACGFALTNLQWPEVEIGNPDSERGRQQRGEHLTGLALPAIGILAVGARLAVHDGGKPSASITRYSRTPAAA